MPPSAAPCAASAVLRGVVVATAARPARPRSAPPPPHARAAGPGPSPPARADNDDGFVARWRADGGRAAPRAAAVPTLVAAALAFAAWTAPPPAVAEVTTVTPSEAIAAAKPLPKAPVDKGRVWLLFAVGAAAVFGAAVGAERVEALFPAIAKANKAVAASRARATVEAAADDGDRLAASVADGLAAASLKRRQETEAEAGGGGEGGEGGDG